MLAPQRKIYRVYSFDSARHILSGEWIEAASDEAAIALAEAAGFGTKCELWDGKRLVAELDAVAA